MNWLISVSWGIAIAGIVTMLGALLLLLAVILAFEENPGRAIVQLSREILLSPFKK